MQLSGLESVRQEDQKDITANVLLAQEAPGSCDRFEETAEVPGEIVQDGVVTFPAQDSLEVLLVFDPHHQDLEASPLVEHPAQSVEDNGEGR